jgi:hypothetical protein
MAVPLGSRIDGLRRISKCAGPSNIASRHRARFECACKPRHQASQPSDLACENSVVRKFFVVVLLAAVTGAVQTSPSQSGNNPENRSTFRNPLLPTGPDPWVVYRDGFYYEMNSTGVNLTIRKSIDITDLQRAETKVVWTPPANGPYSHEIWAPELHFIRGKWYIYFAADAGTNETHRLWVLENGSQDPLSSEWTFKAQLADRSNKWAIDASVFEEAGKLYALWSGWEGDSNGTQNIYIAELKNLWTARSERVKLSSPQFDWEKVGSTEPPMSR